MHARSLSAHILERVLRRCYVALEEHMLAVVHRVIWYPEDTCNVVLDEVLTMYRDHLLHFLKVI